MLAGWHYGVPNYYERSVGGVIEFAAIFSVLFLWPVAGVVYGGSGIIRSLRAGFELGTMLSVVGILVGALWLLMILPF